MMSKFLWINRKRINSEILEKRITVRIMQEDKEAVMTTFFLIKEEA